jgi:hypothetical protein
MQKICIHLADFRKQLEDFIGGFVFCFPNRASQQEKIIKNNSDQEICTDFEKRQFFA